ncbi:GIY-YIG nuclease family protein [Isoptericola sp. NPDC057191]|uniref:GIY-YIG nuclease family protein n=1 Tax=Isoptericola sp. NPDC057191 TaxID=3346041 RepID=UPI00362B4596
MTDIDGTGLDAELARISAPREELAEFIAAQEGRIGDVFTLTGEGLSAREIADRLNVDTPGFVYHYQAHANAALDGVVPTSPTVLKATGSALNGLVKRGRSTLSAEAFDLLKTNQARVLAAREEVDPEQEARAELEAERFEQDQISGLHGLAGIYAFSYGWYLESPLDPDGDNTLIKVGKAEDVARRIEDHRRGARAHIPEPLITVRVYEAGARDLDKTERDFHRLLSTAGHRNPRREESVRRVRNEVGKEWFLTNRAFLDAIATALDLRTVYAE